MSTDKKNIKELFRGNEPIVHSEPAPAQTTKKKFGSSSKPAAAKTEAKPEAAPEEKKEVKRTFTTTITQLNDLRLSSYQNNKPGGAQTTDVVNAALEMFFKANKQYADAYLEGKK